MKIALLIPDNRDEFHRHDEPEPQFGPAPTALIEGLAQLPECEAHVLSCVRRPVRAPERIAPNIFFHALPVPQWGWLRGAYAGCVLALRRRLCALRPDVVHGQGTERYCALAAAFSGFPNLVTVHGNMRAIARVNQARSFSFLWLAARLERVALARARGVLCLTSHTRQEVSGLAQRTWLVPNAVERSFFTVERAPRPRPLVLCVATVSQLKNQHRLLRALDGLAAEWPLDLVFLGAAPPEDPYVRQFFQLLATRPWARHAGFADRPALQAFLREAALLVLPSLEDNCPMAVLEAMAAGVPVCAARVGGVPDLIEPGVTGLLVDPQDEADLGAGVRWLLEDPVRAMQMAQAAQGQARERFGSLVIARRHLDIYRELLRPSAPAD